MNSAPSKFNSRPRLTAAVCFGYAALTVCSLNTMLPVEMNRRFEIGWCFLGLAILAVVVGLGALYGEALFAKVLPIWRSWSIVKQIAVCAALYAGSGIVGMLCCKFYDSFLHRWSREYLPQSVGWWCR